MPRPSVALGFGICSYQTRNIVSGGAGIRYHVEVHMANLLVGAAPIVLQYVVFLGARGHDEPLGNRL